MATIAVSARLTEDEAARIDAMAAAAGMDRSALLKQVIRRGIRDLAFESACRAYRDGAVSLSRAAGLAGIGLRDMILRLRQEGLELNYGLGDLQDDLLEARH
jgi:predicted HTH domain antitoxin